MPKFERCDGKVNALALAILKEFESHKLLIDCEVKIDYVFAYPEYNDDGEALGDAIMHHGVKALGLARKVPLKDRALGRGDAEIVLDGDWWKDASDKAKKALLDHELHHLAVKIDKRGIVTDDLGRPVIQLRKHDFEVGWFKIVAERHGQFSMEQSQARWVMDNMGQYFWPQLVGPPKGGVLKE